MTFSLGKIPLSYRCLSDGSVTCISNFSEVYSLLQHYQSRLLGRPQVRLSFHSCHKRELSREKMPSGSFRPPNRDTNFRINRTSFTCFGKLEAVSVGDPKKYPAVAPSRWFTSG